MVFVIGPMVHMKLTMPMYQTNVDWLEHAVAETSGNECCSSFKSLHDDICKLILISSSIHYSDLVNKKPPMQLSRIKGLALFNITYAFENLWVPTSLHWWFTNSIARVFFLCKNIYNSCEINNYLLPQLQLQQLFNRLAFYNSFYTLYMTVLQTRFR